VISGTHGFNRTGYLICAFLARVGKLSIDEAFKTFCTSRPPGIYRQGFVANLWQLFAAPGLPPPTVEEPQWSHRQPTVKGDGTARSGSRSGSALKRPAPASFSSITRPHVPPKTANTYARQIQFFPGVPGVQHVDNLSLRNQIFGDVDAMCYGSSNVIRYRFVKIIQSLTNDKVFLAYFNSNTPILVIMKNSPAGEEKN